MIVKMLVCFKQLEVTMLTELVGLHVFSHLKINTILASQTSRAKIPRNTSQHQILQLT